MPPARRHSDTRPAEQVLEDLLKPWAPSTEPRTKTPPQRRPFATAFLPHAAQHAPRLPVFRVQASPVARFELRPMSTGVVGASVRSPVSVPSFRAVADAVEARATASAPAVDADDPNADEVPRLAPTSSQGGEAHRFAAQVVAVKAAGGLLDGPTASGGSTPVSGYADLYGGDTEAGEIAVVLDGQADDDAVPRSIFL